MVMVVLLVDTTFTLVLQLVQLTLNIRAQLSQQQVML